MAGNATEMIRQYEAATGRLSSQSQQASGATFNGFDYSYTERGNIAAITESGEVTRDRAYSYDELERLTEVSVPSAPAQLIVLFMSISLTLNIFALMMKNGGVSLFFRIYLSTAIFFINYHKILVSMRSCARAY